MRSHAYGLHMTFPMCILYHHQWTVVLHNNVVGYGMILVIIFAPGVPWQFGAS